MKVWMSSVWIKETKNPIKIKINNILLTSLFFENKAKIRIGNLNKNNGNCKKKTPAPTRWKA